MKSILFSLLSLIAPATSIPALAHQDVITQSKNNINTMLEDINVYCTQSNLPLDDIADALYKKYRGDKNFQELIHVFDHMKKNCVISQYYPFETLSFEYALSNIKQYLNGTEHISRNQIAWVLFIRYNTNESFGIMRQIFEKIASDQEAGLQRYKEAMSNFRKLNRYNGLGIGRHK